MSLASAKATNEAEQDEALAELRRAIEALHAQAIVCKNLVKICGAKTYAERIDELVTETYACEAAGLRVARAGLEVKLHAEIQRTLREVEAK